MNDEGKWVYCQTCGIGYFLPKGVDKVESLLARGFEFGMYVRCGSCVKYGWNTKAVFNIEWSEGVARGNLKAEFNIYNDDTVPR